MNKVKAMPGRRCRFYRQGRCFFEEQLNPGYHDSHRCTVLRGWEKDYDEFISRAEAFGLSEETAADIWEKRFWAKTREAVNCAGYDPGGESDILDCVHAMGDICLRALPKCEGVCRLYKPRATAPIAKNS